MHLTEKEKQLDTKKSLKFAVQEWNNIIANNPLEKDICEYERNRLKLSFMSGFLAGKKYEDSSNSLNELAKLAYERSVKKGFYEKEISLGEKLCLIHSEVSEALEADRTLNYCKGDIKRILSIENIEDFKLQFLTSVKNSFEDELADIIIRTLDLAGYLEIPIQEHIEAKMRYNLTRTKRHGKRY